MSADLGEYAAEVLSAYAASFGLLVLIVGATWARSRRVKKALDEAEGRRDA